MVESKPAAKTAVSRNDDNKNTPVANELANASEPESRTKGSLTETADVGVDGRHTDAQVESEPPAFVAGQDFPDASAVSPEKALVEVAPSVVPAEGRSALQEAVLLRAPHLDAAFAARFGLDEAYLVGVANGEIPPPPWVPENDMTELHYTGGSWSVVGKGVNPKAPGNAISR